MKRITLTQYNNGLPVEIDPDVISSITPLSPLQGSYEEHPCRTRISGRGPMQEWLVRESLDEINEAITNAA